MLDAVTLANKLIALSVDMSEQGLPLMQRILPTDGTVAQWEHYPPDDAVSPQNGSRYFYHCHPPEDRTAGEHGHFHLFLPLSAFAPEQAKCAPVDDGTKRAPVVHFAALSVGIDGLPRALFTVNRWVTDEWLFSAEHIMARLASFDLSGADGDALVNQWLTTFVMLSAKNIEALLIARDHELAAKGWPGEDHSVEITSTVQIDLQQMLENIFAE